MRPHRKLLGLVAVTSLITTSEVLAGGVPAQARSLTGDGAAPIVLQFPSWQENETGYGNWWQSMVKEFEADHPGVKINLYEVGFTDYVQSMLDHFAAGDAPDIIDLPAVDEPAFQPYLAPLDSYFQADGNLTSRWLQNESYLVQNGHHYGLLLQNTGLVLFYNKSILAAHHLTVPTTISQLLSESQALTGNGDYGIGIPTAQDPNLFKWVSAIVTGLGQSWVSHGKWNITSRGVENALSTYRELAKYAPPGALQSDTEEIYDAGKAAFLIDGTFEWPTINTDNVASVRNSGEAPLPLPHQVGYVSSSLQMPSSLTPARRQLVWDFIQQVATMKSQKLFIQDTNSPGGLLAANQSESRFIPNASVATAAANGVSVIPELPWFEANYPALDTDFASSLSGMFGSSASTTSLAQQLQSSLPAPS